jgi:SAM-dependent methyltransferase
LVLVVALLLRPRPVAPSSLTNAPAGLPNVVPVPAPARPAWRRRNAWALDLMVPLALYLGVLASLAGISTLTGGRIAGAGAAVLLGGTFTTILFVRRPVRFAGGVAAMLAIATLVGTQSVYTERTFFGIHRVLHDAVGRHLLVHGTTVHGGQYTDARRSEPLSYYHRTGPLGQLMASLEQNGSAPRDWAVVGLGSGALAAYGLTGQHLTYYEIDPAVERIARDPAFFTYLSDSRASVDVVIADGRLGMAAAPPASYDLIVLDAFSSDAPPAHLMTREAMSLYLSRLRPGGILAFHTSNRYLDLQAAVAGTARSLGLAGLVQLDQDLAGIPVGDKLATDVVLLARDAAPFAALAVDPRWQPLSSRSGPVWSDDFSDILSIIRWR